MRKKERKTIEWLCAVPARSLQDLEDSNLASVRLRTALGIKSAQALGHESFVSDAKIDQVVDAVIVGKLDYITDSARPARWLKRLKTLKQRGTQIIVDYTDHHMVTNSPAANFYKEVINLSDLVITSSKKLSEHIRTHTGKKTIILDDPIEVPICKPITRKNGIKTALWFGHASNLPYLFDYLVNHYKSRANRRLIVMTNLHPLPENYIALLDAANLINLEILVVPWNKKDLQTAASISDFALIPAGIDDPRKSGASSNRLLTSLAMGLPTLADQLDSYTSLKSYFADIKTTNIDDMFDNPEHWFEKVESAQRIIDRNNTVQSAERRWRQAIGHDINSIKSSTKKATARVFQICYTPGIRDTLDPGFEVMGDETNARPDWYEYWHIRNFLKSEMLQDDTFYGFFSPKFNEKTRLSSADVFEYIEENKDFDVILFSPYLDQNALFLNILEQGSVAHPELGPIFEKLCGKYFQNINLQQMVTSSENTVFCNFFVAKPKFWARWFEICEGIFQLIEESSDSLAIKLSGHTRYKTSTAPVRTFIIERIATLIIYSDKNWNVKSHPTHQSAVGKMSVAKSTNLLLALDSLKSKFSCTGSYEYLNAYLCIRNAMLKGCSPNEFENFPAF